MIFSECPYCDAPAVDGYECGDPTGYAPCKCERCGEVMWIERTSIGGSTRSHEAFLDEIVKPQDIEEVNAVVKELKQTEESE